jgi:predicted cupin superfamily sugar epimerase
MSELTAAEVIAQLGLQPHPEGGHFRETFRDTRRTADGRSVSTAIYFLLAAGEASHWHRVDATEIWHWHAGAPLELRIALNDAGPIETRILSPDIVRGEEPQCVVPQGGAQPRRLDAGRLHRGAGLRVLRLRARRPRLGAGLGVHRRASSVATAAPPTMSAQAMASAELGAAKPATTSRSVESTGAA